MLGNLEQKIEQAHKDLRGHVEYLRSRALISKGITIKKDNTTNDLLSSI